MPKDAILPDIAKWFQEHGITCLLYDPRGIGASDGEPRNDVSVVNPGSSKVETYLFALDASV
jgi:hypothetical protein